MSWPRAILTDSGGFQVFSLERPAQDHRRGRAVPLASEWRPAHVHARIDHRRPARPRQRHHDGARRVPGVSRQPRSRARLHRADDPLGSRGLCALPRTRDWRIAPASRSSKARCFPICGAHCAEQLLELDADGYAIGGLSVGEPRALSLEMTEITAPLLPRGSPALRDGRRHAGRTAANTWRAAST